MITLVGIKVCPVSICATEIKLPLKFSQLPYIQVNIGNKIVTTTRMAALGYTGQYKN